LNIFSLAMCTIASETGLQRIGLCIETIREMSVKMAMKSIEGFCLPDERNGTFAITFWTYTGIRGQEQYNINVSS
jgi:hypothetical protein